MSEEEHSGQSNSTCKNPEAGERYVYKKTRKESREAAVEWVRGTEVGFEVSGVTWQGHLGIASYDFYLSLRLISWALAEGIGEILHSMFRRRLVGRHRFLWSLSLSKCSQQRHKSLQGVEKLCAKQCSAILPVLSRSRTILVLLLNLSIMFVSFPPQWKKGSPLVNSLQVLSLLVFILYSLRMTVVSMAVERC